MPGRPRGAPGRLGSIVLLFQSSTFDRMLHGILLLGRDRIERQMQGKESVDRTTEHQILPHRKPVPAGDLTVPRPDKFQDCLSCIPFL